ncbi:MAG: formylmethanofuran dehydrogenase subunit A [bacterium]|mgnify:CR=1 FL=1|jgi:formylmethanofuran dehydrogenase subunit A|nr:formylmethanofuran dehydrogenase subunit A [Bacillota bacterium]HHW55023.1 formylmethanofuran dehydrogenase subunit A [Bacillota bacterium]
MLRIKGGRVYDPKNGWNGEIRDICIKDGKIVEDLPAAEEVIDATGLVVMAGGVDIHAHIAGPKVNTGRVICPEDHRRDPVPRTARTRSGSGFTTPSTFVTGYRYAQMGYTSVFEAAMPPLEARHVHEELADTPILDKGALVLVGNNHFVLSFIREGDRERLKDYLLWVVEASGAYGLKVVNPGGGANWRRHSNVRGLDDAVIDYGVTPRQIIETLLDVNEELGLPHALHLHCNNLGQPGNLPTTLATMDLAAGRRLHITHLQFHAYGEGKKGYPLLSGAEDLAAVVNANPNITIDVGQVVFGPATTMTADAPLQYELFQKGGGDRWVNKDVELETGSGIVPITYSPKSFVGACQWLIGLELFLLIENPEQVFLTTDHPNAGPFTAYPQIIRLLMDRDYREERIAQLPKKAVEATGIKNLQRKYTLGEIAAMTRSGPARVLGLEKKGHLGVGADADVVVYRPQADYEAMFANPLYVFKEGQLVVQEGQIVAAPRGKTFVPEIRGGKDVTSWLAPQFEQFYSIALENYPVDREWFSPWEVVPCK